MSFLRGFRRLRRSFALRNFRLYIVGNMASNVASRLQNIAVGWLTWELTQSAAWLGIIALAEAVPTLILSLLAGTMVDRVDFFRLLRFIQFLIALYAVVMTALIMWDLMTIWVLLGLTIVRGALGAFYRPARMTLIYAIVGRDLLPTVLPFNAMVYNISRFAGPALGGAIIVFADVGWVFSTMAILYLIYSIVLRFLAVDGKPVTSTGQGVIQETLEGLRYTLSHNGIRFQLSLLFGTALLARPLTDLLPAFAGDVFDSGADGLAFLLSAHGLGALVGTIYLAGRSRGINGMTAISFGCVLLMAVSLLLFVTTSVFVLACILMAVVGFAFIVQNVTNQTLIQSAVEPAVRGRVLSLYGMIQKGTPALGALFMGIWAEHAGLRAPVAAGALGCLLLWFYAWPQRSTLAIVLEAKPNFMK